MLEQPQSHRGTEEAQSHPADLSNAKTQRREDAKPTHPPIRPTDHTDRPRCFRSELGGPALPTTPSPPPTQKRRGAETQRRRENCWRLHRTARSRPSEDGRGLLGRDTDPNTSVRLGVPTQQPALFERRPRHLSSPFSGWKARALHYNNTEERQNRHAEGATAGEKPGGDERSRSELASFSPATGDRPIACRSAVNPRHHHPSSATASLRSLRFYGMGGWIWVYLCDLWAILGGWAALRLCGSAPLRFSWCSPLVSWCLGGFSFSQPGENRS